MQLSGKRKRKIWLTDSSRTSLNTKEMKLVRHLFQQVHSYNKQWIYRHYADMSYALDYFKSTAFGKSGSGAFFSFYLWRIYTLYKFRKFNNYQPRKSYFELLNEDIISAVELYVLLTLCKLASALLSILSVTNESFFINSESLPNIFSSESTSAFLSLSESTSRVPSLLFRLYTHVFA